MSMPWAPPSLHRATVLEGIRRDHVYLLLAAVGLMIVMASLLVGVVVAGEVGDLFAQDAAARAHDTDTLGTIQATSAWNPPLLQLGISLLMTSVVVVLLRIIQTIRMRGAAMAAALPVLLRPPQPQSTPEEAI